MMESQRTYLPDEAATIACGVALGRALAAAAGSIHLQGELGAGKTCLVRALLQAMGHEGPVVSPTYTLMEPYRLAGRTVYHLDLYRLADPRELEYLGLRDVDRTRDLLLVEWPEQGAGMLPAADLRLTLCDPAAGQGRVLHARPQTGRGEQWVTRLMKNLAADPADVVDTRT